MKLKDIIVEQVAITHGQSQSKGVLNHPPKFNIDYIGSLTARKVTRKYIVDTLRRFVENSVLVDLGEGFYRFKSDAELGKIKPGFMVSYAYECLQREQTR